MAAESILGNDAPSIRGFADFGERAGLKYAYAAMGCGADVATFKSLYEGGASLDRIEEHPAWWLLLPAEEKSGPEPAFMVKSGFPYSGSTTSAPWDEAATDFMPFLQPLFDLYIWLRPTSCPLLALSTK